MCVLRRLNDKESCIIFVAESTRYPRYHRKRNRRKYGEVIPMCKINSNKSLLNDSAAMRTHGNTTISNDALLFL
jgi:hypothetical protein